MKHFVRSTTPGLLAALIIASLAVAGPETFRRNVVSRDGDTMSGQLIMATGATLAIDATGTGAGFQSAAASGTNGFACTTNGCRVDLGTGASDYFDSDGTNIQTPAALEVGSSLGANATAVYIPRSTRLEFSTQAQADQAYITNNGTSLIFVRPGGVIVMSIDGDALSLPRSTVAATRTDATFTVTSATADTTTSTTVAAITLATTVALTDGDLILNVEDSVGTNVFTVNEQGNVVLLGGTLNSDATTATFTISSDTNDATTSATVAAITLATTVALTDGDLILNIEDSVGTNVFTVNEQGNVVLLGGTLNSDATTATFTVSSDTNDGTTSTTVAAITLATTVALTDGDLILNVEDSVGTNVFTVNEQGNVVLLGGTLNSDATTSTFTISSDTNDATTSATVAAITLATTVALTAGDLILNIEDPVGTNVFTVNAQGNVVLLGGTLNSDATTATFTVSSDTNDGTTSTTVAAITLANTVDLTDGDLILNVENSGGGNMFTVNEQGNVVTGGTLNIQAGTNNQAVNGWNSGDTGAIDIALIAAGACSGDNNITVTGAADGSPCFCGHTVALPAGAFCKCSVTTAGTATVQVCCNNGLTTCDPDSMTYYVRTFDI